jgi:hypothetical protein
VSADNWSTCPLCVADAQRLRDERIAAIDAQYGKVPLGEWNELVAEAQTLRGGEVYEETLREDWELGRGGYLPDDTDVNIDVIYKARCTKCGASARLETSVMLERVP